MSLLGKGIKAAANAAANSGGTSTSSSGQSLGSALSEGVGKIHIPDGYVKNDAGKYFIAEKPGCKDSLFGKKAQYLVNDSGFEAFKASRFQKLIDKGMQKLGISESDFLKKPDVVYGPNWLEIPEGIPFDKLEIVKKGNDGVFRYVFFKVVILYYTEKQLLIYNVTYNIVLEEIMKASTDEYFYKDLIGVTADDESFLLKSSGGLAVEIEFQKPAYRTFRIDSCDADEVVMNFRKILREAKS